MVVKPFDFSHYYVYAEIVELLQEMAIAYPN
jgi:hypothetical protein